MLAYITCVKHFSQANDVGQINALLQGTIDSLANQTDTQQFLVVVANKGSEFAIDPKGLQIHFIYLDIPSPNKPEIVDAATQEQAWQVVREDKGVKLLAGFRHAMVQGCDYVMFIDADDYLHRKLTAWVNTYEGESRGFIVRRGYGYTLGRQVNNKIEGLYKLCGTCNIYRSHWLMTQMKQVITNEPSLTTELAFFNYYIGSHKRAHQLFKASKALFEYVPFSAVVYLLGSGENDSGWGASHGWKRPIDHRFMQDFGFTLARYHFFGAWLECAIENGQMLISKVVRQAQRWKALVMG